MIAKNLSQHQIHCFFLCVSVRMICACVRVCVGLSVFVYLCVCVCVRGRGSPQGGEEKKRESCLMLDYTDDGKEGEDRNTRRYCCCLPQQNCNYNTSYN